MGELEERTGKAGSSVKITATEEDLKKILMRWEGAVSEVEREGDDSPEAVKELNDSRAALLDVLRQAKIQISRTLPENMAVLEGQLSSEQLQALRYEQHRGPIYVIKLLREITGCTLKDAHQYVRDCLMEGVDVKP